MNSLTGLTALVRSNCSEAEPRVETNLIWSDYVNPCALLLLYFYFAFETNRTFFHQVNTYFVSCSFSWINFRHDRIQQHYNQSSTR